MTRAASDAPLQTIDLPTGPATYTDEGAGHPYVCVHGLPGSVRDFRWLAPHLAEHGRVIRLDLPGFGGTPAATRPDPSPEARAAHVIAMLDALELPPATLIGHSMGGPVAAAAALEAPARVARLALIASVGVSAHAMLRRTPFRPVARVLRRFPDSALLRVALRFAYDRVGFRGYPDSALARTVHAVARFDMARHAARIERLDLPTMVAWAADDPIIPERYAQALAAVCPPGPRVRFVTGGHNPQKNQAENFSANLAAWQTT